VDLDTEAGPEDVPRDNWRRNSLGRLSEAISGRGEGDGVHPSGALADPILTAVDDNGLAGNECGIVAC